MKQITTILLIILALGCNAQEPDVHTFSQSLLDSINISKQLEIDSLKARVSLLEIVLEESAKERIIDADTFYFELVDDRIKVEINKQGHNVWFNLIDGEYRINSDYINYETTIRLMSDTAQVIGVGLENDNVWFDFNKNMK